MTATAGKSSDHSPVLVAYEALLVGPDGVARWHRISFVVAKAGDLWDGVLVAWANARAEELKRKREHGESSSLGSGEASSAVVGRQETGGGGRSRDSNRPEIPDPRSSHEGAALPGHTEGRPGTGEDVRVAVGETRRAALANHQASGALTKQQEAVLKFFSTFSGHRSADFTRQELSKSTGLGINVICARVNELIEHGQLMVARRRRCSITGQDVEAISLPAEQLELAA